MEHQFIPRGDDKNTASQHKTVHALFVSVAFVFVSLRFYVRAWMMKNLWWDDFFLLLGMLFAIAAFGLAVAGINSGIGRQAQNLSPKQLMFAVKLKHVEIPVVILSGMFTRISVCFFLLRIFSTIRVWKRAMYIIMALIVVASVSSVILILLLCKPIAKKWNPTIKGTCWPQETQAGMYYYQGGVAIFTDFLLAFLPIYFLKDIQISFRTKLSICALMSLGAFTGVCAINRTVLVPQIDYKDLTSSSKNMNIWSGVELNVGIIAAAIPALRPLWGKTANQNRKNRGQANRPNSMRRLNTILVMMDPLKEFDSLPACLETRITAQGGTMQGGVGREATSMPDGTRIMKTSDFSMKSFRKFEGKQVPEDSSLSDKEERVEDIV